jgi:hypothetical protein
MQSLLSYRHDGSIKHAVKRYFRCEQLPDCDSKGKHIDFVRGDIVGIEQLRRLYMYIEQEAKNLHNFITRDNKSIYKITTYHVFERPFVRPAPKRGLACTL